MAKRSAQKRDFMEVARGTVEQAIGEQMDGKPLEQPIDRRNPHAVALGSMGGKKGGKARAKKLSSRKRSAIARKSCCLPLEGHSKIQKRQALETFRP